MLDLGHTAHLTLPRAAYAAGVNARTFRAWVESGAVPLLVPRREAGAWLRVAPADVVRLAVFGHLLSFGTTMAEAGEIVTRHVDRHLSGVVLAAGDIPWPVLRMQLLNVVLYVSRCVHGIVCNPAPSRARHPAELTVNVGAILFETHRRARSGAEL